MDIWLVTRMKSAFTAFSETAVRLLASPSVKMFQRKVRSKTASNGYLIHVLFERKLTPCLFCVRLPVGRGISSHCSSRGCDRCINCKKLRLSRQRYDTVWLCTVLYWYSTWGCACSSCGAGAHCTNGFMRYPPRLSQCAPETTPPVVLYLLGWVIHGIRVAHEDRPVVR